MLNNVSLVGRATKDIEVKKTTTGKSVSSFYLACDRNYKDQGADFIKCEVWNQPADYLGNYVKQGDLLGLEGRLQSRTFDARDGSKVFETYVLIRSVRLLSRTQSHQGALDNENDYPTTDYDDGSELPY